MKYKLLLVEEDPQERHALLTTLNTYLGAYLTILEAGCDTQALELFHRENPQIALLNTGISAPNGLELARKFREHSNFCAILFISDQDDFSYAREAISLRALDYIMKPCGSEKLIPAVKEAITYCSHFQTLSRPGTHFIHTDDQISDLTRLELIRQDISAYIDAHYAQELSMKNVAHAMNYSDAYFCKLFKQCFQSNFSTYLNMYRVQKAKAMMENSRASVKEISIACGYTDPNYFTRIFKRVTSMTPSEYRIHLMKLK